MTDRPTVLSVVAMLRELLLAGVVASAIGCAAAQPTPEEDLARLEQRLNRLQADEAARPPPQRTAAEIAENAEYEANKQRINAAGLAWQLKQRQIADDARIAEKQSAEHSREEWLEIARDICHPNKCDGGPVDVNCMGDNPPEWAMVQASVESCLNPRARKRSPNALSPEDEAAWRKRVSGK